MLGAEWHCRVEGEQRSKVGVVIMTFWCCCMPHIQKTYPPLVGHAADPDKLYWLVGKHTVHADKLYSLVGGGEGGTLHFQTNFTHWLRGIPHTRQTLLTGCQAYRKPRQTLLTGRGAYCSPRQNLLTGMGHTENPDIHCVPFAGHTAGH